MKFSNLLKLCSILVLSANSIFAHSDESVAQIENYSSYDQESHFGYASFAVENPALWYTIETNSYPETVQLSQSRNKGIAEGNVFLSPTGFTIGEAGNYWVSFSAVLQNPSSDDGALIPVFLVIDETFDFDSPSLIGSVIELRPNQINTAQGTGILKDVAAGSRISLVATNGGNPFPQDVNVSSWSISVHKLP